MEGPIVIDDREELIFLLCEASELEHMILCQYLYASFSLKQRLDEGLTQPQLEAIGRWERSVTAVAVQEMLHLALVSNLLTSIGAAAWFHHAPFPQRAKYFPPGIQMSLMPFGEHALQHFLFLERPEGMERSDAPEFAAAASSPLVATGREIVPVAQDFATVGHFYRGIESGFRHLVERYGERGVFVGPPEAQCSSRYFGWPELIAVTDLASAIRAIETIVEEGEGARGHWENAHYGRFLRVYEEFVEMRRSDPSFEPARPVIAASVRPLIGGQGVPGIEEPSTARVADLFNGGYEALMQVLARFFLHGGETDAELMSLASVAVELMFQVVKPLGHALTTLPIGPSYPGKTAGATFEVYRRSYLLPHRSSAWVLLRERLQELADDASDIASAGPSVAPVAAVADGLRSLAKTLVGTSA